MSAVVGFDIETNSLQELNPDSLILTWAWSGPAGVEVHALQHPEAGEPDVAALRRMLLLWEDPTVTLCGSNIIGFDVRWIEHFTGRPVLARLWDTKIAQSLLDETRRNSMEELADHYAVGMQKNEEGVNRKKLAEEPLDKVMRYNAADAEISRRLYEPTYKRLKVRGLVSLAESAMESALVLTRMSARGIKLDVPYAQERLAESEQKLREITTALDALAAEADAKVLWTSPKQVSNFLYGTLGWPVLARSRKTKQPSSNADALGELKQLAVTGGQESTAAFLDTLIERGHTAQLLKTFYRPVLERHLMPDGKVHTTFNVGVDLSHGTVTGRLSSSGPNLQNIPRDSVVRGMFVPSDGHELFSADYSQIELVIAAQLAGEQSLLDAFDAGQDVHTTVLAMLENVPYAVAKGRIDSGDPAWVDKRALVKRVNFGVLYGVSAFRLMTLMRDMGIPISLQRAEEVISEWFDRLPRVASWITTVQQEAIRDGYTETVFRRRRNLEELRRRPFNPKSGSVQRALRQAVNFQPQGTAADIMLSALVEVDGVLKDTGAHLLLSVHDELVGEYDPRRITGDQVEALLREGMVSRTQARCERLGGPEAVFPLKVDVKTGLSRWTK